MIPSEMVKKVGLLSDLSDDELQEVARLLQEIQVTKGSLVFQEGQAGDALYIVSTGRLKETTKDERGHQRVLTLYGQGDFFGEMALLGSEVRSSTVAAITDSTLAVLRKVDFENFLASNIGAVPRILKVVAERQSQTSGLSGKGTAGEAETPVGKIIAVYGPKGGVGRTTVAVNLAAALKETTGRRIALVDGSLGFGDVGVTLNLVTGKSVYDLVPNINDNELDYESLEIAMCSHPSGIQVLLAPPQPEIAELVTPDHMHIVLTKLCEFFDFIVVDTSSALHDTTLSILDASDLVLVLTTVEMAALKNVRLFLNVTESLGYSSDKTVIVINRSNSTGGIPSDMLEGLVGRKFMASIVSDGRLVTYAGNKGVPFVIGERDTRIASDIIGLTTKVLIFFGSQSPQDATSPKKRILPSIRLRNVVSALVSLDPLFMLLGLGTTVTLSIALLFMNMLVSAAFRAALVPYSSLWIDRILLIVSAFAGALLAVWMDDKNRRGWTHGLVLGISYGILVIMVTLSWAELTEDDIFVSWPLIIASIPMCGLLGLAGGITGRLVHRP